MHLNWKYDFELHGSWVLTFKCQTLPSARTSSALFFFGKLSIEWTTCYTRGLKENQRKNRLRNMCVSVQCVISYVSRIHLNHVRDEMM